MNDPHLVNYWASFVFSYRNLHELTQEQLSERLNVSQQTVSRWEAGQQVPDPRSQAALREVLGEADLTSKKNWIERVSRASGLELLIDRKLEILAASNSVAAAADTQPNKMKGKPFAKYLPAKRPKHVDKAAEDGFFDGAFARISYATEINLGPATYYTNTDVWPVLTTDAGILMHVVITPADGPQKPGLDGLAVSGLVLEPNAFVGQTS
jgi:transcriptional regulator with XRE-family HTH domain